jgi:predicted HD superfamily hydrolase involved in NAD metabolism
MIRITDVLPLLRKNLGTRRYIHSLSTMAAAVRLAPRFGAGPGKAALAGLLHDCAKSLPKDELIAMAKEYGWETGEDDAYLPILHGAAGAVIARTVYGVTDPEVLSAIGCHVTGKREMSPLDQTVYLADLIEPGRTYAGVDEIQRLSERDVHAAMVLGTEKVIGHVKSIKGLAMHPQSMDTLKWLKKETEEMH